MFITLHFTDIDKAIADVLGKKKKELSSATISPSTSMSFDQFSAIVAQLEDVVDENAGITDSEDGDENDDDEDKGWCL